MFFEIVDDDNDENDEINTVSQPVVKGSHFDFKPSV